MTEDEAKTKWCPQAEHRDWKCVGSACMAWRWSGPKTEEKMVHTTEIKQWESHGWRVVKSYHDYQTLMQRQTSTNEPSGFCGLAGRP
jgi:hypothetical protein